MGSRIRWILDPEHGKNVKMSYQKMMDLKVTKTQQTVVIKCTGVCPWGESTGGLFIGVVSLFIWVVRGSGINVRTPPNHPFA
jgi:hypothetical protein